MELEKLRQVIAEVLSVDPREVTEETTFVEDLCADSLDVYQIIMGIEDAFGIEIPASEAEKVTTVKEAVEIRNTILQGVTFREHDIIGKIREGLDAANEEG